MRKKRRLKKWVVLFIYNIISIILLYLYIKISTNIYYIIGKPYNIFIYPITVVLSIKIGMNYFVIYDKIKKHYKKY